MTGQSFKRTARINRDQEGNALGIAAFVSADELRELGIEPRKFNSITVRVTNGSLEVTGGNLRDPKKLDQDVPSLSHDEVPHEMTKTAVGDRFPDETPTDYACYWERQRNRAFAFYGFECQYCGLETPGELDVTHIHEPSEYNPEELYEAHEMSNLIVLCDSCNDSEDTSDD